MERAINNRFKKFKPINMSSNSKSYGIINEELIMRALKSCISNFTINVGYYKVSRYYEWLAATADGIINYNEVPISIIEIKTGYKNWGVNDSITKTTGNIAEKSQIYY